MALSAETVQLRGVRCSVGVDVGSISSAMASRQEDRCAEESHCWWKSNRDSPLSSTRSRLSTEASHRPPCWAQHRRRQGSARGDSGTACRRLGRPLITPSRASVWRVGARRYQDRPFGQSSEGPECGGSTRAGAARRGENGAGALHTPRELSNARAWNRVGGPATFSSARLEVLAGTLPESPSGSDQEGVRAGARKQSTRGGQEDPVMGVIAGRRV